MIESSFKQILEDKEREDREDVDDDDLEYETFEERIFSEDSENYITDEDFVAFKEQEEQQEKEDEEFLESLLFNEKDD